MELEKSYHGDLGRRDVVVLNLERDLERASSNFWAVNAEIRDDVINMSNDDVRKLIIREIETSPGVALIGIIMYVRIVVPDIKDEIGKVISEISKIPDERQPIWRAPVVHSWKHTQVLIPSRATQGKDIKWEKSSALDWLSQTKK